MDRSPSNQNQPIPHLRAFVSADANELAAERGAVRQAVSGLRLTPVMFEPGARLHAPRELYQTYLPMSQVFIGIYWQQYGWVAPGESVSALEDEFRLSEGLPRLIYVRTPSPQREAGLQKLLAQIKQEKPAAYRFFSTAEELSGMVKKDLALLVSERFATGGDDAAQANQRGIPASLPLESGRFIGREIQVEATRRLLLQEENRLVSLTGPDGMGKTRLAIQSAAAALAQFPGGAAFVDLGALDDTDLVLPSIARALGEPEAAGEQLPEKVRARLRSQPTLLVLDALDRAASAVPPVMELLNAAPGVKILATSQSELSLPGEIEFPVPPLALPGPAHRTPEQIAQCEAVELFLDRAGRDLVYTPENAPLIAEVCERLDGIPLAIELAASIARLGDAETRLANLAGQLKLATGGQADHPDNRQMLRAAMGWSYNLLEPAGQALFARLAVFQAGCTLEAAEAVCSPDGKIDVLEASGALVRQNLVQRELDAEGRLRFSMRETLRGYALGQLEERGELSMLQERHAHYYGALANEAANFLKDLSPATDPITLWPERLDAEIGNLRAALRWFLITPGGAEPGARLAGSLFRFWRQRGYLVEAWTWHRRLLSRELDKTSPHYAALLAGAGMLSSWLGAYAEAHRMLDESIPLLRGAGQRLERAEALLERGILALNEGHAKLAQSDLEEALRIFRVLGQRFFTGLCLVYLANTALAQSQPDPVRELLAEAAAIARRVGDRWLLAFAINAQGEAARWQGDYSRAGGYTDDSGALFHEINARGGLARILHNQAYVALRRGDVRLAGSLFHQGLDLSRQLGIPRGIAECLAGLAGVDAAQGRLMPAARLLGFAQAMIESLGMDWQPADRREIEREHARLQDTLGEELFRVEEASGRVQKLEAVLEAYAGDLPRQRG